FRHTRGAPYPPGQPGARSPLRSGDDHEIGIAAGCATGCDLAAHLVLGNDLLALEVATAFRSRLIFEVDPGHACLLELLDGAHEAQRIAITLVSVGDHRHVHRHGDVLGVED